MRSPTSHRVAGQAVALVAAAFPLAAQQDKPDIGEIAKGLRSDTSAVRIGACQRLAECGPEGAHELARRALESDHPDTWSWASSLLADMGEEAFGEAPYVVSLLDEADPLGRGALEDDLLELQVRVATAGGWGGGDDLSASKRRRHLEKKRQQAIEKLVVAFGPASLEPLAERIADSGGRLRDRLGPTRGRFPLLFALTAEEAGEQAIPKVRSLLESDDPRLHAAGLLAAGAFGLTGEVLLDPVIELTQSEHAGVRWRAFEALRSMSWERNPHRALAEQGLQDDELIVRLHAAALHAAHRPPGQVQSAKLPIAAAVFVEALEDRDPELRAMAAALVDRRSHAAVVEKAMEGLSDRNAKVRYESLESLYPIAKDRKDFQELLTELAEDEDERVASLAQLYLAQPR